MADQGSLPFDPFVSRAEMAFNEWIHSPDGVRVELECVIRARLLKTSGCHRYSIDALFHSIRFDWTVGLLGDQEYRLNNNHHPFMSRRIMRKHPDLEGFFETRVLTGAR